MTKIYPKTKRLAILMAVFLTFFSFFSHSQTVIHVGGNYTGAQQWVADTVKVDSDVLADELTINPGVVVEFQGPYGIKADTLIAVGTKTDSILFTINDTTGIHDLTIDDGGWKYLRYRKHSELQYCIFEFKKYIFGFSSNDCVDAGCDNDIDECYYELKNCTFRYNYSDWFFMSARNISNSCFFANVSPVINGSCIANYDSCTFAFNSSYAAISIGSAGYNSITNCHIYKNKGIGINCIEPSITQIEGNIVEDNQGSGLFTSGVTGSARFTISNNIFRNNQGYGIDGDEIFGNISNNIVAQNGKGGLHFGQAEIKLTNNLITNNTAQFGGGIFISIGEIKAYNNTIVNNKADYGGGIYLTGDIGAHLEFYNTIIRDNTARIEGSQYYRDESFPTDSWSGLKKVYHCNIKDLNNIELDAELKFNIDVDPYFADTAGMDYSLTDSSLCINAGTPDTTGFYLPETDLAGNPRIYCGTLDIGAYEYQGKPVNRAPFIFSEFDTVSINSNDIYEFTVDYKDFDYDDEVHVSVSSSSENIYITLPAVDTSGSIYVLEPQNGWIGEAEITVRAEDVSGKYTEKSFILIVENSYCGEYSGLLHWSGDTVKINCDIVTDKLVIDPGVVVEFQGNYTITTNVLNATGTVTDTILFTINDTTGFHDFSSEAGGWGGIRINDSIAMKYCKVEYGKNLSEEDQVHHHNGIISYSNTDYTRYSEISNSVFENNYTNYAAIIRVGYVNFEGLVINTCSFSNNLSDVLLFYGEYGNILNSKFLNNKGAAITIDWESGIFNILNNIIKSNKGYGIRCASEVDKLTISANSISYNYGGIYVENTLGVIEIKDNSIIANKLFGGLFLYDNGIKYLIVNNVICFNENIETNYGGGITILQEGAVPGGAELINNTICYNSSEYGGGVYVSNGDPLFYNNIIRGNRASIAGSQVYMNPVYTGYWGPWSSSFYNCNIEGGLQAMFFKEYEGIYENNIDVDPYFADTSNFDFSLTDSSLCINAGTPDVTGLDLPETDVAGNPRIYCGTVDIGAYEFQGEPLNRKPYIQQIKNQFTNVSTPITITIHFFDADKLDTHTIEVSSITEEIDVEGPYGDTSGSQFTLIPENNWEGESTIDIKVTDNHGNFNTESFRLRVYDGLCGIIESDTVFSNDTIHVTCDVIIDTNVTVLVNPGTIFIFEDSCEINVYGKLDIFGSEESPVRFTIYDSLEFLNTMKTGWGGINFQGNSDDTTRLEYCILKYANSYTTSDKNGGAIKYYKNSPMFLSNSTIEHCIAKRGGGIYLSDYGYVKIINSTIGNNIAFEYGGGVAGAYNAYVLENKICDNVAFESGGGLYNIGFISGNMIYNNKSHAYGGGVYGSKELINNCIYNNTSSSGGGISDVYTVIGNIIINNKSKYRGGGVIYSRFLYNNVIANNVSRWGGGISTFWGDQKLCNNTIANNKAELGGGIYIDISSAYNGSLINNIISGNISTSNGSNICFDSHNGGGDYYFINNLIEGGESTISNSQDFIVEYENNIDDSPLFTSPTLGSGTDFDALDADWSLTLLSPCINSGTPDTTGLALPGTDINGNPRIAFDTIDIGAYEFVSTPIPYDVEDTLINICEDESLSLTNNARFADSVQWLKNGTPVSENNTITFDPVSNDDEGEYVSRFYNEFGAADADGIFLNVMEEPEFISLPGEVAVCESDTLLVAATITGDNPLEAGWVHNLSIVSTDNKLLIKNVQSGDEGMYYAVVVNQCGYDTAGMYVTVNSLPEFILTATPYETGVPPVIVKPDMIFPEQLWSDNSDGDSLVLDDTWGYGIHDVWLQVTNENGCHAIDTIVITLQKPDYLKWINVLNEITIAPNPFSDIAFVYIPGISGKQVTIQLYNNLGQKIMEDEIVETPYELTNRNYAPGVYTIVFISGETATSKKVIIR